VKILITVENFLNTNFSREIAVPAVNLQWPHPSPNKNNFPSVQWPAPRFEQGLFQSSSHFGRWLEQTGVSSTTQALV
jgi:hypothetical protein